MDEPVQPVVEPKVDGRSVNVMSLNKQLQDFKGEVNDALSKIVSMLEAKPVDNPEVVEEIKEAEPIGKMGVLAPQYEAIFAKYFDRNDGFSAEMDYLTRNAFAIFVPEKFSNATPAYLDFYKRDIRSKMLKGDDVASGMEAWCKLVARNLHYSKNVVTK